MSFGTRLTEVRKRKGLTQEALGKGLATHGEDASKSVVYGWEKDQHFPKVDQLVLICNKLGCSSDYLLFGREGSSSLSPEAAAIAADIDTLQGQRREQVLLMCRQAISLARNGGRAGDVEDSSVRKSANG